MSIFCDKKMLIIKCCNFINILNFLMRFFFRFKYSSRYTRISTKPRPQIKTKNILAGLNIGMLIFRDNFWANYGNFLKITIFTDKINVLGYGLFVFMSRKRCAASPWVFRTCSQWYRNVFWSIWYTFRRYARPWSDPKSLLALRWSRCYTHGVDGLNPTNLLSSY